MSTWNLETNLLGRLRNTKLPLQHGLLPMFEAVVNSIHSIEDAGISMEDGWIQVEIVRSAQQDIEDGQVDRGLLQQITGFKVKDNGVGFNKENMRSFRTLDSDHKVSKGCRGVGRLLWLKAFRQVTVISVFEEGKETKTRKFTFSNLNGVNEESEPISTPGASRETLVHLEGFVEKYRERVPKGAEKVANELFEHCLWYFVREEGVPRITIQDHDKQIVLNEFCGNEAISLAQKEEIEIKGKGFKLVHIKRRMSSAKAHYLAFCAASRLVKEEGLNGKIPGLHGKLEDGEGEFVYACYVTSSFLDDNVRAERTDFDIVSEPTPLLASTEVSLKDIKGVISGRIEAHLSSHLEQKKRKAQERIREFVSHKSPRYRPIIKRIPENDLVVDPNINDKDLELHLHKQFARLEQELLKEGHEIMAPRPDEAFEDYHGRLTDYLAKADDIKKSDLASYVSHRKVVLDLLEKAIELDDKGKYVREDVIHQLIMPMRVESDELLHIEANLWIIDERLSFHEYLASDKTLKSMPVTGNEETKEPDLFALNVFDNPMLVNPGKKLPLASIVVVEIKRPMRNDAKAGEDKDPIEQALGYLDRIRKGKVTTVNGRPIPSSEEIPGFCYVVCDITPSVQKRCELMDATRTSDGLGYFRFHKQYNAYIEVISFDRLVKMAKERNRAFFDKLGLPT